MNNKNILYVAFLISVVCYAATIFSKELGISIQAQIGLALTSILLSVFSCTLVLQEEMIEHYNNKMSDARKKDPNQMAGAPDKLDEVKECILKKI